MNDKIKNIIAYTQQNGGCSFNSKLEILEDLKGYTISIQKYEYKVEIKNITKNNIDQIEKNILKKIEIIKNKKNYILGTWCDRGILYIDINKIEMNYTRACEFGKSQKQLAIYDNINKKTIYLKKDTIYILYEYLKNINDIRYITEFKNKKELVKSTGFYEFRNIKKYIYNKFDVVPNYYIKNNKKYIIIEEEA